MIPDASDLPQRVERVMSLSEQEFAQSVAALLPLGKFQDRIAIVPLAAGHVTITFEPLPSVRLGQSLELPRARVVLTFAHASPDERGAFLARFDIAFQRGGG